MNKYLLILILRHLREKATVKKGINIFELIHTINTDDKLGENVSIEQFTNDIYSVREIKWLKQILKFNIY